MKNLMLILFVFGLSFVHGQQITKPVDFFGFQPGTDRMLFDYEKLIEYLEEVDQQSPKMEMREIGTSPEGRPIYIAFISSYENIQNIDQLKTINQKIAWDISLSDAQQKDLIEKGKVFVLATLSMHSGEVGPSQAAPLMAYDLLTTSDPQKLNWLDQTVFMMVPCHNPDGMDMIVQHYNKYKGTKYEGSSMPGIYHKYVGHDNNRDFVTLSQSDTRAISKIYSTEWMPQVMVEKHQMGSRTARYFVPPMHDPITENVDATLWNWTWVFGSNMITDMTKVGLQGISQHYLFDDYWPGSTETCIWKNTIGMLTEAASVKYASPIYVEPNELSGYGKGLSEYKKSINMPELWPGGWWRLSDIVQYEIESMFSILKTSANRKAEILKFRNELAKKEVEKGKNTAPYFYIFPKHQHDQSELAGVINLLKIHGVKVYQLSKTSKVDGMVFEKGDVVVPLAQPTRAFIKEVLEAQKFPERHYTPGGELIKPYDITSWSLPLHRGLKAHEINTLHTEISYNLSLIEGDFSLAQETIIQQENYALLSVNENESYRLAFKAASTGLEVQRVSADFEQAGRIFPKGSFLIDAGKSEFKELVKSASKQPLFLKDVPANLKIFSVPKIALVETYFHDMDAGWTRYVLDSYSILYKVVRPGDFKSTNFKGDFDVVIFPDAHKSVLMEGKYKSSDNTYNISSYPPDFTKGIGKEGMDKLMTFLEAGGTIVSWGRSCDLFIGPLSISISKEEKEEFQLPLRNIAQKLRKEKLYCPGSLLKIELAKDHPLTMGMQDQAGVFFRGRPVFTTSIPNFDMDRRVIAKFPEEDILMSGYCQNVEKLANKTVMTWLKKGKGQLVLIGFNPQFRASTQGTYKLLFNALLLK